MKPVLEHKKCNLFNRKRNEKNQLEMPYSLCSGKELGSKDLSDSWRSSVGQWLKDHNSHSCAQPNHPWSD
jgi:hypothetical protein